MLRANGSHGLGSAVVVLGLALLARPTRVAALASSGEGAGPLASAPTVMPEH